MNLPNAVSRHVPSLCRRLPVLGLGVGLLTGAGYGIESGSHMVVEQPIDRVIVAALLATVAAAAGWLVGTMIAIPLDRLGGDHGAPLLNEDAPEAPCLKEPAAERSAEPGKAIPDRERVSE